MKDELIVYNAWDIEYSTQYMSSLCNNNILHKRQRAANITGETFNSDIDLRKTLRGNFYNCDFCNVGFNNFDCSDYYFFKCALNNCTAENSNFKYLGMVDCNVQGNKSNNSLINTPFECSILEKSQFANINIHSCNFQNTQITNCKIKNTKIFASDFTGSIISDTTLDNIDFLNVDIQFVEFNNVKVSNISFLMLDILHCYYGINMIFQNQNNVRLKLFDDTKEIKGVEFIQSLDDMMPYLYSINDFFALANICIFRGNHKDAFSYILMGLKYNIEQKDFKLVRYLCKLASLTPLFSRKELKIFYESLKSEAIASQLTRFEYRHYMDELTAIKYMLIDNPSNLIKMVITINTMIDEYDYDSLSKIIETIDMTADSIIPQTQKSISIRHNSSPVIEIFLNDSLSSLVAYFALLSAFLGCSLKFVKQIYTIAVKRQELEGQKLSNKLKEAEIERTQLTNQLTQQEIEKAKAEHNLLKERLNQAEEIYTKNSSKSNISRNDVAKISYDLQSNSIDIPNDLRNMNIQIYNIAK